jgi:putative spermidine/putrescine transport system permease protein
MRGNSVTGPSLRLRLHVLAVSFFLLAPLVMAVVLSFSNGDKMAFPPPGFSLRWYEAAFANDQFMGGLWRSLWIAAAATAGAMVIGSGAAIALNHYRFFGRAAVQLLIIMPLALPGIVVGLGQLFGLRFLGMMPGDLAAAMSHAVLGVPYVTFLVLSALSSYDLTLEQASANLGARWWRTFRLVTFPHIRSGVIAGGMFAFLISFDQISTSLFVARGDTLPLRLLQHIQYNNDPSVAAVSSLLVAGALLLLFLFGRALRDTQLKSLTDREQ